MKNLLSLLSCLFLSTQIFSQSYFPTSLSQPSLEIINNTESAIQNSNSSNASYAASSSSSVVIWSEDFANGLSGNNPSIIQNWTVGGTDANVWEHDLNGSDGPNTNNEYTLNSETKTNGWMIFDAYKSNANAITPSERQGELISPVIDLSQDTNVTLQFTHQYVYCCKNTHKLNVKSFKKTDEINKELNLSNEEKSGIYFVNLKRENRKVITQKVIVY